MRCRSAFGGLEFSKRVKQGDYGASTSIVPSLTYLLLHFILFLVHRLHLVCHGLDTGLNCCPPSCVSASRYGSSVSVGFKPRLGCRIIHPQPPSTPPDAYTLDDPSPSRWASTLDSHYLRNPSPTIILIALFRSKLCDLLLRFGVFPAHCKQYCRSRR